MFSRGTTVDVAVTKLLFWLSSVDVKLFIFGNMPVAEEVKSSWADEVELEGGSLPPPTEVRENGYKYVTEYKYEDEKKFKIIRTYKIEKRLVSKTIALRKTWKKFGESTDDKPGPNPATTIVGEDVYMQYVTSKEEDNKQEDEGAIDKLKCELHFLRVVLRFL